MRNSLENCACERVLVAEPLLPFRPTVTIDRLTVRMRKCNRRSSVAIILAHAHRASVEQSSQIFSIISVASSLWHTSSQFSS
jgi:hypothetical protein